MSFNVNEFKRLGAFYDDNNYPRGFNKSGEFTKSEAEILQNYGKGLKALQDGREKPANKAQEHFLKVCKEAATPGNDLEKAWMKYQNKISKPSVWVSAFGSRQAEDLASVATVSLDEPASFDDAD